MEMCARRRKQYIDVLRAAATVAVVFYHCEASGDQALDTLVKILFNWCVPVFLMITGALFLDSEHDLNLRLMLSKNIAKMLSILLIFGGGGITFLPFLQ